MRPIDADSLVRLIEIRMRWHKSYTKEEILNDIKQAPTLSLEELHESCTKDVHRAH